MKALLARVVALRRSTLVRNAGWGVIGEMVGLSCQILTFLLVAREFGSSTYGTFAGIVALMLFVSPFSSAGAGYIIVSSVVSKAEDLGQAVGRAWTTVVVGFVIATLLLLALRPLILPQAPVLLFLQIAIAELLFNQLVQANRFVVQTLEKMWLNALTISVFGISRLLFAWLYLGHVDNPSINVWGLLYFVSVAIGALAGMAIIWIISPAGIRPRLPRRTAVKEGMSFSINASSAMLKGDADKTLLVRFDQAAAAGIYAAAYRVLGASFIPNVALADATYARFFREGAISPRRSLSLAKRMSAITLAINLVSGVVMLVAAPVVADLLGGEYNDSVDAIRWLAFIPMLAGLQLFAGNALSGCGLHRTRLHQMLSSAVLNIALNIVLIPKYSWKGAAFATLLTEVYAAALHWWSLTRAAAAAPPEPPSLRATTRLRIDALQPRPAVLPTGRRPIQIVPLDDMPPRPGAVG